MQHEPSRTVLDKEKEKGGASMLAGGVRQAKRLTGSSYLRAIATLSGGQVFAAIIPFFIAPILGRIYGPTDYALVALYTATTQILGTFATLQYQVGIVGERSDRRATGLIALGLGLSAATAILCLIVVAACYESGSSLAALPGSSAWILAIPLSVFWTGVTAVGSAWANRERSYRLLASMQVTAACSSVVVSIVLGTHGYGADGLLMAYLVSQGVMFAMIARFMLRRRETLRKLYRQWHWLKALAIHHRGYPIFTLPSGFTRSFADRLPVFLLTHVGAPGLIGLFSRTNQLIAMPISLLSLAVSQVYFQRAARDFHLTGTCLPLLVKTASGLFVIGIVPFGTLWLFGEHIFRIYLGPEWSGAGEVARAMVPMFFLQFVMQPVNSVFQFSRQQHMGLKLSIVYLILVGVGCSIPFFASWSAMSIIYSYSTMASVGYVINFIFAIRASRGSALPSVSKA